MTAANPAPLRSASVEALTICLVAAEQSGDRLGAALMRALKASSRPPTFIGVGGQEMLAEGLRPLVPIREFAFMGWLEPIKNLPAIYRYIQTVAASAIAARPDVLVIIDSPALTHQIARRVRRHAPSIPIVDYVSPSVWAWRPGRARRMRSYVDHVLALLPFEPAVHARLGGPPCSYVGHPLIEQVDGLRPNAEEADRRQGDPPILLVLPGSRAREVHLLLDVFGKTIELLRHRLGELTTILPTVPKLLDRVRAVTKEWPVQPQILVDPAQKLAAFRIARAALAKSGTVTLELALAGVPMVTAYKVPLFDEAIARLVVKVPSVILANLIIGENVVPEILQRDCTPRNLADALEPLLIDSPQRRRQIEAFARLDAIMEVGRRAPSARAAEIVLSYAERQPKPHAGSAATIAPA